VKPTDKVTFGSLFAGIGGFDLGLERAGMQCAWQVEIDSWCRKILSKHWPAVPRFEDVRECGVDNLSYVDLICGGFPCQGISSAGKRKGLEDERSGLWSEFSRIVCELRPRFVLVENVAALRIRGLDVVLSDLAASGYDAEWDCIPASAVGAPHRRDRIWVVAHAEGERAGGESDNVCETDGRSWAPLSGEPQRTGGMAYSNEPSQGRLPKRMEKKHSSTSQSGKNEALLERCRSTWGAKQWAVEPGIRRVAHGVPRRVDRLRGLGNAVVPQVVEFIGRRIMNKITFEKGEK